ncbi:Kyphoscoliosis peptidase [Nymphon striatum]|nr:Kyphoscoliosis peptidase [Nymphon striatum]
MRATSAGTSLSGYAGISVEEYKRPKFETSFEPVIATYKVNDSVTVNGTATAYAGSNITDAKVTYRKLLMVKLLHDASGKYEIDFKALPDASIDKKNLPTFSYEITADVTDINGETHSATTIVTVGYHTMTASMSLADPFDKDAKENKLNITTNNLNGQFVPAKGSVKMYKLKAPKSVNRPRKWAAPDYAGWSKDEFKKLYPNDAFSNEHDASTWDKGELVWQSNFDTGKIQRTILRQYQEMVISYNQATDETWSFKIKGPKGDKVAAELLANMYDASLDTFRSHYWGFNPLVRPTYYSNRTANAYNCFGTLSFNTYADNQYYGYDNIYFDSFNWFGLHFGYGRALYDKSSRIAEQNRAVGNSSNAQEARPKPENKDANKSVSEEVKIRKNLQENAFFFPQLKTDAAGNVTFSFTTPEALTKWNVQLLAHNKKLESAYKSMQTVTQKELMVIPNAPRFLREGDEIYISSKISNLTEKALSGRATLKLVDAVTGLDILGRLIETPAGETPNPINVRSFEVDSMGNSQVSWRLNIPEGIQAVQYTVIAKAGDFSDGEQNVLPVLTNRMLVTETLPMWVRSNQTKTFTLDKLKNTSSTTLKHHKLTLEVTSNPAWYAVQALPYLMEYPYECNEQTFSKYYANTLASHIANSNPRIQDVFKQWANSDALVSNLEKNQELKSLLIQETPWLRDAQSETEQKKRIALLFNLNKMKNEQGYCFEQIEAESKRLRSMAMILRALEENSITSEELGMYWKSNTNSWHWYQAPIETQALLIEAFAEIHPQDVENIDNLKIWLLKNKQTSQWKTTKATSEAVYALLLQGSDWLSVTDAVDVLVGGEKIDPSKLENVKVEAGTGYYKTAWNGAEVKPKMAEVQIAKKGNGISWGAMYWQYFEDLDKITSAETPLKLKKKLFLKKNTDTGEEISEITAKTNLKVGDLVKVRIELRADRPMEFFPIYKAQEIASNQLAGPETSITEQSTILAMLALNLKNIRLLKAITDTIDITINFDVYDVELMGEVVVGGATYTTKRNRADFSTIDFAKADSVAFIHKGESLENLPVLTHNLTANLTTDAEKFRAIYTWVCTNIENDYGSFLKTSSKRKKFAEDRDAFLEWNNSFTPKVFEKLVNEKKTACTGYAYLISELANLANLKCKIVNGYGRTATLRLDENSIPNHSWNAVELNNKWYLCDATWSAGRILIEEGVPEDLQSEELILVVNRGGSDQIIQPGITRDKNNLTLDHSFEKTGLYDVHIKVDDVLTTKPIFMNSKVFMVLRIILGLYVIVFGLDKFIHFIDFGESAEAFGNYMVILENAKVMYLAGVIEIIAGLALIFNKYGALMALLLMSVSINAFMAHAAFMPESIAGAAVLVLLNLAVLFGYKEKYKGLLAG